MFQQSILDKLLETDNNQIKRWILPKPVNKDEIKNISINYTLQKVLCRRGIDLDVEFDDFISPPELPNPEDHFNELNKATQRIVYACNRNEKIAICGDYDADGITSTVLLVELLTKLGAKAKSYIPSRQEEGYGLNINMIKDIYNNDIKLIITVDNGISAFDAIEKANELGIDLIITDHHKISKSNQNIFALIHPEMTPLNSPYKYLAGVGIAYMMAKYICKQIDFNIDDSSADVLFCIGTIADMAPLLGANRKWLKECLPKINKSSNKGIKSIIKKLKFEKVDITSDDIGYKIAPLINAVGRIGDPNLIFNLLINDSEIKTLKLANECFELNEERKRITYLMEVEANDIVSRIFSDKLKFIVVSKREWHPGIIGIVAARIAEKYNLPTAVLSGAKDGLFRGSVRSNNQLKVNDALHECNDILISYGGHSAAAGFTIKEDNIPLLIEKLNNIGLRDINISDLSRSIKPDACINLSAINSDFFNQIKLIGPFGVMNTTPIFWTRKCKIIDLKHLKGNHIKMTLDDGTGFIEAVKWNNKKILNINEKIDIAFNIQMNYWNNLNKLQLNILDIKKFSNIIELHLHNRLYKCKLNKEKHVVITNNKGESLTKDLDSHINKNIKDEIFARKILSFAEIALGKVA